MPELIALTPELVNSTFVECLAVKGRKRVRVKVGRTTAVLDVAKLEGKKEAVAMMLSQLPPEFMSQDKPSPGWVFGSGAGATIRNACLTTGRVQWTGKMVEVERLLALGVALGWVVVNTAVQFFTPDAYITITLPQNL